MNKIKILLFSFIIMLSTMNIYAQDNTTKRYILGGNLVDEEIIDGDVEVVDSNDSN